VRGPWQEFDELLAEPFIRGRELTTAVLGDQALGVTEFKPKSGFYDYDAKYTDGLTEHVFPADIPEDVADACKRIALDAHRLLGCKGCSRSDFRWDDSQGVDGLFLLEVNTQPGMTPLSLVPNRRGISASPMPSWSSASWTKRFEPKAHPAHRDPAWGDAQEAQGQWAAPQAAEPARSGVAALPFSQATLTRIATWSIVGTVGAIALGVATWFGVPAMAGRRGRQCGGRCRAQGRRDPDRRHQAHGQDDRLPRRSTRIRGRCRWSISLWSASGCSNIPGSRTRASRAGCPTRCASSSSSASRGDLAEPRPADAGRSHGRAARAGVERRDARSAAADRRGRQCAGARAEEAARRGAGDQALVKAATWVGNRRWDLTFASGEKLQLPEGELEAAKSLRKFAELDAAQGLLRKGTIRFDMRVPGNMVMQRPMGQSASTSVETGE
jgi:hypothetical protein